MTWARVVVLALPLAVLAACGGPQIPPAQNYGTIQGRVYDAATNQGVPGVAISVDVTINTTSTNSGNYTLVNVPLGQYDLAVTAPEGYTVGPIPDANGSIIAGQTITIDIPLTKQ